MLAGIDPAFADDDFALGNQRRQSLSDGQVSLESAQVPVVDADDFGPGVQGSLKLRLVVNLH
jgi:hypothetical protein